MLEEALTRAVVTAIQLGIPEEKARDMLMRLYQKYDSRMRRQENE